MIYCHFYRPSFFKIILQDKAGSERPNKENEVNEALPETYGENRNLIPDDTFVLVGFYKTENLDWIIKSGLYNARADSKKGLSKVRFR